MNDALSIGVTAFVAGLLGTTFGATLIWRMVTRWPLCSIAHQLEELAQAYAQGLVQLRQSLQNGMAEAVEVLARAEANVVQAGPAMAPPIDLAPLNTRVMASLQSQLEAMFEAQNLAHSAALQKAEQSFRQALQRDLQREDHRAAELRVSLTALVAGAIKTVSDDTVRASPAPSLRTVFPPAVASARPPELLMMPITRPDPVYEPETPDQELTDEELDALPPDLPAQGLPRKRILPAPTKPPSLRSL